MDNTAIKLCALNDIEPGSSRGFDMDGNGRDNFFVVRQGDQIYAWRNACPHLGYEGSSMPWKKNAYLNKRSQIMCSAHGALFEIESGVCVSGPCPGKQLTKENVQVGDDGFLYWYK